MAKSKKKKRKTSKKRTLFSKKNLVIVLFALFSALAIVYAVNYFELVNAQKKTQKEDDKSTVVLMNKMKQMLDEEKKRLANRPTSIKVKELLKLPPVSVEKPKEIENQNNFSEIRDYKKSLEKKPKAPLAVKEKKYTGKPKLAIIIDDVAFAHQTRMIKKIPYKVTASFFPPTQRHPDTINLAKDFKFKMIHLPTEALSFGRPEPETLLVGDSKEKIRARIKQIKTWFPDIKYYNNHTGSKFTADYESMDKLMMVMKEEKLHFVDSRTTADTQVQKVAKKHNMHIYSRDIFIDNSSKEELIRKQLKKAVGIAKKRGYAVAIGHPHKNTLKVLTSAGTLLRDVELVYLKDL